MTITSSNVQGRIYNEQNWSVNAITSALLLLSANTSAVSQHDAKEQYIVTLNMPTVIKDSSASRAEYHQTMADIISTKTGAEVVNVYYDAVKGFTVKATQNQISQIRNSATVAQVYKDSTFTPQKTFLTIGALPESTNVKTH